MKKNGFTLVELLVGMSILVLLMIIAIGTINPKALTGKAFDSTRKKDLNKIRTAFEEYFNDKGSYPSYAQIASWNILSNCGREITDIKNYIKGWPCDPDGKLYTIVSDGDWFKVITNLANKNDEDIPRDWYIDNGTLYSVLINRNEANYGVSSSNILWYEETIPSSVCGGNLCLKYNASGCNAAPSYGCSPPDICYFGNCSASVCRTTSCK